jgi:hypothetical protein
MAAKSRANAQGRPVKIRELANAIGYTYEHARKIYRGPKKGTAAKFTISPECNRLICEFLGLNEQEMWEKAEREKFSQKLGYVPMQLDDPRGRVLSECWDVLEDEQRDILIRMAESFAAESVMAKVHATG